MKIFNYSLIVFILIWSGLLISRPSAEIGLSELQKARAEIIKLKIQLLQCQVNTVNGQLGIEKASLEADFRRSLGVKDEEVFDWNSLTFKSVPSK